MNLSTDQIMQIVGGLLASGVLVSLLTSPLKKFLGLESKAVIHTLVVILSFGAGVAQYIQQFHTQLPPEILGVSATAIYGFSQIVYKYSTYLSAALGRSSPPADPIQTHNVTASNGTIVASVPTSMSGGTSTMSFSSNISAPTQETVSEPQAPAFFEG